MNERAIFLAVLEIDDPAERSAYLDIVCAGDPDLRSHVEELLKAHPEGGRFKDRPAPERRAEELATPGKLAEMQDETPADDTDIQELAFLLPSDKPGVLGLLGRYEVLQVIGKGGMGIVLRAFDEQLHRVVAIKVMAAHLATNVTARKRFSREARTAAAVTHDHIVTLHAVEEARGLPYLVMKYVAGQTLKQRLDRQGPLQLPEILRIGMETASGLAAAHARGLIQRDIKPANILLESEPGASATGGRVKITDFGLARAADDVSLTQSGVVAGTPDYMSPEQARGEALDARTDLFSLGSVLYALCTGRPPFRAGDVMATLHRVCEDDPTPIRAINPEIPKWLVTIIDKLHAKDPAQRFQSAAELAGLLNRHLAQVLHPPVAPLPSQSASGGLKPPGAGESPGGLSPPLAKRRRWAVASAIVVLFLGGLVLTEATGVTRLTATVIRVFTPDGTPVVDVDDPGGEAAIEGGGLVIAKAEPSWVQLFNGKDLAGWKTLPEKAGGWRVENGELVGTGNPTSLLATERTDYENFHFRVEVKINQAGDSGQYFRTQGGWSTGYEAQISVSNITSGKTGTLSRFQGKSWSTLQRVEHQVVPADTWFVQEVIADGSHLVVKINGQTVVNVVDSTYARGYLALEAKGADTVVQFRKIEVKELLISPDLALERAEKALEKEPNNGVLLASLGTAYYRARRWPDAIRTLLKADEAGHGTDVSFSPFVLAMAHWHAEDSDKARDKARQWYGLGQVWLARQAAPREEQRDLRTEAAALLGLAPQQLSPEQAEAKADWLKYLDLVVRTHPEAAWAWMNRASAFEQSKQWDKAAADYRRAVEIGEKRVTEPPLDAHRLPRLALAHQELARVLLYHLSQPEEAAKSRQRQVDLFQQLVTEFPKDAASRIHREQLGHTYRWVAFDFEKMQHSLQAEKAFAQAIDYLEKLVGDFPDRPNYYGMLADTYDRLRQLLAANGKSKEAGEAFDHIIRVLASFPPERATTSAARASLADLHHRRGNLLREAQRLDDAEIAYCQAIAVRAELADQYPTERSHRQELGRNHNWLGIVLAQQGRTQAAGQEHRLALDIYEQLTRENDPSSGHWHRRELAWTCLNLAEVLEKERQFDDAMKLYRRAGELSEKLAAERADSTYPYWGCQGYGKLIYLLTGAGRLPEAKEVCRKLLAFKPPLSGQSLNGVAWSLVAGADPKSRAPDLALELAQKAVELEPTAAHIVNTLGVAQYRAGDWKAAISTLKQSEELVTGPQFFDANGFFIAMASWRLGEKDQARKWYAAALIAMERRKSQSDEQLRFRAEATSLLGPPEQFSPEQDQARADEVKFYTLVLDVQPEVAWPYPYRAGVFAQRKEWDKAAADYSKVIELGKATADVWNRRGVAHSRLGQKEKALADYTKASELDPRVALYWSNRGSVCAELNRHDQAAADYSKAIELKPGDRLLWINRANAHVEARQWDRAVADYSRAIELKSDDPVCWNWRGVAYSRLGQKEKALADYGKAIELQPKEPLYWSNRGSVYGQLGQHDQAVADYSKAIELKSDNPVYWNGRGVAYSQLGQKEKALADYSKAIELRPNEPLYWSNRGNVFAELGRWDKAAPDFVKAVELKEDDPAPRYRLALVRLQLGDQDEYRKVCAGMLERFGPKADTDPGYWTAWTCVLGPDAVSDWKPVVDLAEKSLAADPQNFDKLQHMGAVLYRAGRFEEAAKRLTEAEAAFPEAKNPRSTIIYTWLFQAMTQHRLGPADEAKRLLKKAMEAIDQPPDKSKDANAGTWNRRLTLQLLRRELAWTCFHRGEALEKDRRLDEAMELYRWVGELYEKLAVENPDGWYPYWGSEGYGRLAILLAAAGRAAEAEQACRKLLDLKPEGPLAHFRYALLRLHLGGRDAHRTACADMLTRFRDSPNPDAAYWTAWTCTLAPDAVSDWQPVVRLAEKSLALAEKSLAADPQNCDRLQLIGAVLYRAGRFEEALKRLTEAEAAFQEAPKPRRVIYNWLFQAMTRHRLGQAEEAKRWFAKAVEAIDQPPEKFKGETAKDWSRQLTLQLWRREAQTLLGKE